MSYTHEVAWAEATVQLAQKLGVLTQHEADLLIDDDHNNPEYHDASEKYRHWQLDFPDNGSGSQVTVGSADYQNYDDSDAYLTGEAGRDSTATEVPHTEPVPAMGTGGSKAPISVDQNALQRFKKNVTQLENILVDLETAFAPVTDVTPGKFGHAFALKRSLIGSGKNSGNGMFEALHKHVSDLKQLMWDVGDDMDATIVDYDSVEELNKLTADQLNERFHESFKDLGDLGPSK